MKKITFKEICNEMGCSDLEMAVTFKISPSTVYLLQKEDRYPTMRLLRHIYQHKAAKGYRPMIKDWVISLLEEK